MTSSNRSAIFAKAHKVLKKHYKPVATPERPLLEHMLYACCLENSTFEAADEAMAKLQELFFNWNEVRVTTVAELSEVIGNLKDPRPASQRLKKTLQSIFETHYTFDVDFLKKLGQGKALKEFEKFHGLTSFGMAYVTQHGLGGHAIPTNRAALEIFYILDAISESHAEEGHVPGLERAIPKNKGFEFASLLHQFAVDFAASPHGPRVRGILLEIAPQVKDRLPKRGAKKENGQPAREESKGKKTGKDEAEESGEPKLPKKKKAGSKKMAAAGQTSSEGKKSPTKRLTKKKPR